MKVTFDRLTMRNFRQIEERSFEFGPGANFIVGKNGSGKTNTLHAITWCLFGKDLDDRAKFDIVPLNPDNTSSELEPDVILELTIDGQPTVLRRRLKDGRSTQTFIDDAPTSTLKEFDEFVASIFSTPERFKMYTNPLHFPAMNWREQREIFMQFFPEPPQMAIFERMEQRQGVDIGIKAELLKGHPVRLADKYNLEKKELEDERTKIRNQLELINEQLEGQQVFDQEAMTLERMELRKQVHDHRQSVVEISRHNSLIDARRGELEGERQMIKNRVLSEESKAVRNHDQMISFKKQELAEKELKLEKCREAYLKAKGADALCPTCGQPIPEEKVQGELARLSAEGKQLSDDLLAYRRELEQVQEAGPVMPDLGIGDLRLTEIAAEIAGLGQLKEMPVIDQTILDRLEELDRALARADVHKENLDRRAKLMTREREINRLYEACEQALREIADYLFYRSELIVEAVNKGFKTISVKVLEIQKNGAAKETFEILKNGVPYVELNTAGKLLAGLELTGFIKDKLEIECPSIVDNGERYTDVKFTDLPGQLLVAYASKGKSLTVTNRV